jgi:hypothetical protein
MALERISLFEELPVTILQHISQYTASTRDGQPSRIETVSRRNGPNWGHGPLHQSGEGQAQPWRLES